MKASWDRQAARPRCQQHPDMPQRAFLNESAFSRIVRIGKILLLVERVCQVGDAARVHLAQEPVCRLVHIRERHVSAPGGLVLGFMGTCEDALGPYCGALRMKSSEKRKELPKRTLHCQGSVVCQGIVQICYGGIVKRMPVGSSRKLGRDVYRYRARFSQCIIWSRPTRSLRERAGLQATALARAANLSQGTLTRLEKDERQGIQLSTACRLAAALGISVDELASKAGLLDLPDVVSADVKPRGAQIAQAIDAAQKRLKAAAEDLSRAQASLKRRK